MQALVDAVVGRYDIPQRWYRLKAQLLGLERIADYDRMASVADVEEEFSWSQATEIVLDAYGSFSDELAGVVRTFFDESWIDAPVRPGKRPGAFCSYTVPCAHPYLLLNWTSRRRDVLTLAHELGHGLHAYLARQQGDLPPDHAAHPGRDGVGVRRDRHLRAAARATPPTPRPGWRCWPRASRARSPRCSARWR